MGLSTKQFWRMTPLEFDRRVTAYRRKQEVILMPFRRLETAIWNVQIAKTKDGKQLAVTDLYPLDLDQIPQRKARNRTKKPKMKTWYSSEEMQAITDFFNQ
ncbi:hypothetical protein [Spirosoma sp. KNUC1025]|uniref:hypothetical protein n=1 Tax=Spirosoma sp. KNUC1025 TaxID=2894082 RepID=UPI00386AE66B|nr:hypothetical protein LN737_19200 [Spirosoma sp. KNUC1025]